jgi:hypothetical protein
MFSPSARLSQVACNNVWTASLPKVRRKWVPLVRQEQSIITKRRHGDTDLLQIEKVLKRWDLAQKDTVRNGVRGEESRREVIGITRLARVGTEYKGVCARTPSKKASPRSILKTKKDTLKPRS